MSDITREAMNNIEAIMGKLKSDDYKPSLWMRLFDSDRYDFYEKIQNFTDMFDKEDYKTVVESLSLSGFIQYYNTICQLAKTLDLSMPPITINQAIDLDDPWTYIGNGRFQAKVGAMLSQLNPYLGESLNWDDYSSINRNGEVVEKIVPKNLDIGDVVHFKLEHVESIDAQLVKLGHMVSAPVDKVVSQIEVATDVISENSTSPDFASLSVDARISAIREILDSFFVFNTKERQLLELLKSVADNDLAAFWEKLNEGENSLRDLLNKKINGKEKIELDQVFESFEKKLPVVTVAEVVSNNNALVSNFIFEEEVEYWTDSDNRKELDDLFKALIAKGKQTYCNLFVMDFLANLGGDVKTDIIPSSEDDTDLDRLAAALHETWLKNEKLINLEECTLTEEEKKEIKKIDTEISRITDDNTLTKTEKAEKIEDHEGLITQRKQAISADKAQDYANQGYLVIASMAEYVNDEGEEQPGHVGIVAPQDSVYPVFPGDAHWFLKYYTGNTGKNSTDNIYEKLVEIDETNKRTDITDEEKAAEVERLNTEIADERKITTNAVVLRDYPVIIQAGTYTGFVPPSFAFSRSQLNKGKIFFYLYSP